MMEKHMNIFRRTAASVLGAVMVTSALPAAAETRSFVVSMFAPASYNQEGDCSKGVNITVADQYVLDMLAVGYTKEQIEMMQSTANDIGMINNYGSDWGRAIVFRAKVKGKAVSAWINPQAALDPNLNMIDGKLGVGFDLDGRGPDQASGFEDPLTKQKGIDNQFFRATGCFTVFRGTDTFTPGAFEQVWTIIQPGMPAWLITIEAADFSKDGDATVTFDVSPDHVERDAGARSILQDSTFRLDRTARSRYTFAAQIKNGEITAKQPGDLVAIFGEPMAYPRIQLSKSQFRFQIKPDRTLRGVLGGYQPWKDTLLEGYQAIAGTDHVGLYYNLRKAADANPDPKTGENRDISIAFFVDAVPAYVAERPSAQARSKK